MTSQEKKTNVGSSRVDTSPVKRNVGAKVSTIANMFQQNLPLSKDENVFFARPGIIHSPEVLGLAASLLASASANYNFLNYYF